MNAQKIRILFLGWLILVGIVSCTPTDNALEPAIVPTHTPTVAENEQVETAVPTLPSTEKPAPSPTVTSPAPGDEAMSSSPVKPTPSNPAAQEWVQQAIEDLTQRLEIEPAQIELINYQTITWPDGSLGCPQPGMGYIQVLTEGYRIQLQVDKLQYDYHGADGRPPFLCLNPPDKTSSPPSLGG